MSDVTEKIENERELRYAQVLGVVESPTEEPTPEHPPTVVADEPKVPEQEPSEGEESESPETEPAPDTGHEEKKDKGKSRFSRRIDDLTREKYEVRQENEELRKRIEQLERGAVPPQVAPPQADGMPQESDFNTVAEYARALAAYEVNQALSKRDAENAQREREERDTELLNGYFNRVSHFKVDHPDYDEVTDFKISRDIAQPVKAAIWALDNGEQVAYHLGKNPDQQDKLNKMDPIRAVAYLGTLSATLNPASRTSPKPATPSLPEPITPVGGSTRVARELGELDPDAYMAERRKQRAARRGR